MNCQFLNFCICLQKKEEIDALTNSHPTNRKQMLFLSHLSTVCLSERATLRCFYVCTKLLTDDYFSQQMSLSTITYLIKLAWLWKVSWNAKTYFWITNQFSMCSSFRAGNYPHLLLQISWHTIAQAADFPAEFFNTCHLSRVINAPSLRTQSEDFLLFAFPETHRLNIFCNTWHINPFSKFCLFCTSS